MIRLNLMAGMGNQMFEYAYARALSLEYNENLEINPYFMTLAGVGAGRKKYYNNVLLLLNIPKEVRMLPKTKGYVCGFFDILSFVFLRKWKAGYWLHGKNNFVKMCKRGRHYTDDAFSFYGTFWGNRRVKKIIGYYQCERYFGKYKNIICQELKVTKKPSEANEKLIKEISNCNAVCVHIRRGDYVSNEKNKALVVCNEDYYRTAMKMMKEQVENPVFYIFSDNNQEIEWIKEHYHFENYNVKYVTLNNPDYEELRLMYHCKHFVIANSTFSWWGAYLSDNERKTIIAPKVWNKEYSGSVDVHTEGMILI